MFDTLKRMAAALEGIRDELRLIRENHERCIRAAEAEAQAGPKKVVALVKELMGGMTNGK
mgnify:CR=1 FL=1|jgi:hypothetical protein